MIVVLADDLSGAAELAGAAAKQGLKAEVHTTFDGHATAEVVAVDTDTRGLPANQASERVSAVAGQAMRARPSWIYKKVDSVLRGHIQVEIQAIMAATGLDRALLIPANPSKDRVIRNGIYFVEGRNLTDTPFALDPEFPATTSQVIECLRREGDTPCYQVGREETPGADGITIPDAESLEDLKRRAEALSSGTLAAGGVDFFKAILQHRVKEKASVEAAAVHKPFNGITLLVCGSAAAIEGGRMEECRRHGFVVSRMPEPMFMGEQGRGDTSEWAEGVLAMFKRGGKVMVTVGRGVAERSPQPPGRLIGPLVDVAAIVIKEVEVGSLMMEGGATAKGLLERMAWTRLGVELEGEESWFTISERPGLRLLIKPGSYPWIGMG